MKIETVEDWNAILTGCGCCAMPECPVPTRDCESVSVSLDCYFTLPNVSSVSTEELCRRFAKYQTVYNFSQTITDNPATGDNYIRTETTTTVFEANYSVTPCSFYDESIYESKSEVTDYPSVPRDETYTYSSQSIRGGACTGSYTFVDAIDPDNNYSGTDVTCTGLDFPITNSYTRTGDSFSLMENIEDYTITTTTSFSDEIDVAYVLAMLSELTFADDSNGAGCIAEITADTECPEAISGAQKSRFRWVIPDTWTGSYYKITWDILEEPDGWDDPSPTVSRSFYLTDQTWTWAGPGDPEVENSWKSGWYEIPPPSVPGSRRIVNVRFECYKSAKFGNRPQVTGEAVELPDP